MNIDGKTVCGEDGERCRRYRMDHPQSRFASQPSGPCNQGRPAAAYSCATVVASSPTDASGVRYTTRPVNGSIPTLVHRSRKRPSACARKAVSDILVVAETRGERMRIGLISSVRGSAPLRPLHGQLVLQLRTALRPQPCLLGCCLAFACKQLRCLLHGSASTRGAKHNERIDHIRGRALVDGNASAPSPIRKSRPALRGAARRGHAVIGTAGDSTDHRSLTAPGRGRSCR